MTAFTTTKDREEILDQEQLTRSYGPNQSKDGCFHQCTRCAVIFSCHYAYARNKVGFTKLCGNPFYNGKCRTCKL